MLNVERPVKNLPQRRPAQMIKHAAYRRRQAACNRSPCVGKERAK